MEYIRELSFLEIMLHAKKLRYEKLTEIMKPVIRENYINSNHTSVNIFIDVFDVIKQLYNPKTIDQLNSITKSERYIITSEIINMAAHYRHYCCSRLQKYANIYFFYSDKKSDFLTKINKDYKKDFYSKRLDYNMYSDFGIINNIIKDNIKLIKNFLEYVPSTYFINSGDIEPNVIPSMLIPNSKEDEFNIIISNEEIFFQDLNHDDKTIILQIKGDNSRVVTKYNMMDIMLSKSKTKKETFLEPELYTVVKALTGYKNYNIESYKKMANVKAINHIENMIKNNKMSNVEYNLESMKEIFKDKTIIDNFRILNNKNIINNLNDLDYTNLSTQIVDRVDPKTIRFINDKYFTRFPILLEYLFEGESY